MYDIMLGESGAPVSRKLVGAVDSQKLGFLEEADAITSD